MLQAKLAACTPVFQCNTVSEVAADWHELMLPQHIKWQFFASEQLNQQSSQQTYHHPDQPH